MYGRISKDKQGRFEKVETQVAKGRSYCAERWPEDEVRVYADNDLSAADPDVFRPDYDRLLHDIRAGHVDRLVCAEQSRLTRQPSEWEDLVVILSRAGIKEVHQYRGGVVQVQGSRLVGRILAAVDAEEVERLKARINDRLGALADEGRPHGGRNFAYRHVVVDGRKHLEVDSERAEVVRQTAERLLAGWSLSSVAADLNSRAVPTARGGKAWSASTVRSMVTNPTVAGLRTHRGQLRQGTWGPVLDEDTWRAVSAILAAPVAVLTPNGVYRASRSRPARRRYLLTGGIAVCGVCGAPMAGQRRAEKDGRKAIYACHPSAGGRNCVSILAEPVEELVAEDLFEQMDRPGFWDAFTADPGERTALLARRDAVIARQSALAAQYAAGDLEPHEWQAAREVLQRDRAEMDARLATLTPTVVRVSGSELRNSWFQLTLNERRAVLETHVEKVQILRASPGVRVFDRKRVVIDYRDI